MWYRNIKRAHFPYVQYVDLFNTLAVYFIPGFTFCKGRQQHLTHLSDTSYRKCAPERYHVRFLRQAEHSWQWATRIAIFQPKIQLVGNNTWGKDHSKSSSMQLLNDTNPWINNLSDVNYFHKHLIKFYISPVNRSRACKCAYDRCLS